MKKLLILMLLFAFSVRAQTFVQAQFSENTGGSTATTQVLTLSPGTTGGDCLVLNVGQGTDNTTQPSISDSAGNTWNLTPSGFNNSVSGNTASMWYVANASAIATSGTITATWSVAQKNRTVMMFEFSGCATSSLIDTSVNNTSPMTDPTLTSPSFTTTNANDVIVWGVRSNGSTSGWAAGAIGGTTATIPTNGTSTRCGMEYLKVTSTQSGITATITNGNTFSAEGGVLAIKASGAAPPPCTNFIALLGAGCK